MIVGRAIIHEPFARAVVRRGTPPALCGSRSVEDQFFQRSRMAIARPAFLEKWAGHKSLPARSFV